MKIIIFILVILIVNSCSIDKKIGLKNTNFSQINIKNNVSLNQLIKKLYGIKHIVLESKKIDIKRFKHISNRGKIPLSIKSNIRAKSITILLKANSTYKVITKMDISNSNIEIYEYILYFNLVCKNNNEFIVLVEDYKDNLYVNKNNLNFAFGAINYDCEESFDGTYKGNYSYQKELSNHSLYAKLLKNKDGSLQLKTKIFNKQIGYSQVLKGQEKYFISQIIYKVDKRTFLDIYLSDYMDKHFTVKIRFKDIKKERVIDVLYQNIFGQKLLRSLSPLSLE